MSTEFETKGKKKGGLGGLEGRIFIPKTKVLG
jgi:hypothetical protein